MNPKFKWEPSFVRNYCQYNITCYSASAVWSYISYYLFFNDIFKQSDDPGQKQSNHNPFTQISTTTSGLIIIAASFVIIWLATVNEDIKITVSQRAKNNTSIESVVSIMLKQMFCSPKTVVLLCVLLFCLNPSNYMARPVLAKFMLSIELHSKTDSLLTATPVLISGLLISAILISLMLY